MNIKLDLRFSLIIYLVQVPFDIQRASPVATFHYFRLLCLSLELSIKSTTVAAYMDDNWSPLAKCGVKLLIRPQTSTVAPLKFGNGWIILSHTPLSMMKSSNGKVFRVIGSLWEESTGHLWFLSRRPVTWSFEVYFDLRLNKRLSEQSRRWWLEKTLRSLWRHCTGIWLLIHAGIKVQPCVLKKPVQSIKSVST